MKNITIGNLKPAHEVITLLAEKVRETDKKFYCNEETSVKNLELLLSSEGNLITCLRKIGLKDSKNNIVLANTARTFYRNLKKQLHSCDWIIQSAVQKLA